MKKLLLALALILIIPDKACLLELDGNFIQGGLIRGKTEVGAKVTFNGDPVRVSADGIFLFGFSRDSPEVGELVVQYSKGTTESKNITIERRNYDIQKIDGLPPEMITPKAAVLKRIQRENLIISEARRRDTPVTFFESGWVWPAHGRISGVYGSQRILNGKPRQPHYGVDISAPLGETVIAPADGIVSLAESNMYFSGGTLILDHGHGLSSAFLHLSRILVKLDEFVEKGDEIAEIGSTGRATGPHLDWRINLFNKRIDPALLVELP